MVKCATVLIVDEEFIEESLVLNEVLAPTHLHYLICKTTDVD